jgi:hypothetical protein
MKQNFTPSVTFSLATLCFGSGFWLLSPGRNVFGNPTLETLLSKCAIPNTEAIIRLYEGNGGGTSDYWYSVTFQTGRFDKEQQILYTYGTPTIKDVECQKQTAIVKINNSSFTAIKLPLTEVKQKLLQNPVGYYRGKRTEGGIQPLRVLAITAGIICLLLSAILIFATVNIYFRQRKLV